MNRYLNRQQAIEARQAYIAKNRDAFKGNSSARRNHVESLKSIKLTDYQYDLILGMLLSDASVDFNDNNTACRIKMQQSHSHYSWLESVFNDLIEYMGGNALHPVDNKENIRDMYEIDTLTCNGFDSVVELMYQNYSKPKIVKPEIKPYISEVTLANWFCGDGSKRSHDREKGIHLHGQGFSKDECEILADAIRSNLGFKAYAAEDTHKSQNNQKYILIISGTSYDSFIEKVGPYIHPCFKGKLPAPRSDKSSFGYMNQELFDQFFGSKLVGDYVNIYKRPKY